MMPEKEQFVYDDSKERVPPEQWEQWTAGRLFETIRFAYDNALSVKDKFDKAGITPHDIKGIKDLEKIPITTKDELVRLQRAHPPFGGFLTVPMNRLRRIYVSPGPTYDVWDCNIKGLARYMKATGFVKPGDVVLNTVSYHMVPAGLVLTEAADLLGLTIIPAGVGQTELQVQIIKEPKVTGCIGFASFLISILKKAEEMGYDVQRDFSLRWVLCGGEKHLEELRKTFKERYGIESAQNYGTADLGVVAYECTVQEGMHYNIEDVMIEIVDPSTGKQCAPFEEGEVVVTLLNKIYPLIRFGTGDLSMFTDKACSCGRTTPRLISITGMIGDRIRAKGLFIHGRELDKALSEFSQVLKYQIAVSLEEHKDRITLTAEIDQPVDQQALSEAIRKRCKELIRLTLDEIIFVSPNTLPPDFKKFVDQRWK